MKKKEGCWGCESEGEVGYGIDGPLSYSQINPCDYHLKLYWKDKELDVKIIFQMRTLVRFLLKGV